MTKFNHKDIGLINRAVRERWNIPPEVKNNIVETLRTIIENEESPEETRIKAANSIVRIDSLNLSELKLKTPRVNVNVFAEMTIEELEEYNRMIQRQLTQESRELIEEPRELIEENGHDFK